MVASKKVFRSVGPVGLVRRELALLLSLLDVLRLFFFCCFVHDLNNNTTTTTSGSGDDQWIVDGCHGGVDKLL
jgi:hypothetical protein